MEEKRALRKQKLCWCEGAAWLPAAGASLNTHISNNLESYKVQARRVDLLLSTQDLWGQRYIHIRCPRKTTENLV